MEINKRRPGLAHLKNKLTHCAKGKVTLQLGPILFLKMDQSRPLFVYFRSFLVTISTQLEKKHRWCAWDSNPGRRMVGADETTELWRSFNVAIIVYTIGF